MSNTLTTTEWNNWLKKQKVNFDYDEFLISQDQEQYFIKTVKKLTQSVTITERLRLLKKFLRNIDWNILTNSGLLQPKFILLEFTKNDLYDLGIIQLQEKEYVIPIRIIHFLDSRVLSKLYDLTKIYTEIISSNSSDSNSSYSSNSSNSNSSNSSDFNVEYSIFQKVYQILDQDRLQYSNSNNFIYKSKFYISTESSTSSNSSSSSYRLADSEMCYFDDFIQFYDQQQIPTNQQASKYSVRIATDSRTYLYDSSNSTDSCNSSYYLNKKPVLQYFTYDKIFIQSYTPKYIQITTNNKGVQEQVIKTSTTSERYIADIQRYCGLNRINLIKYQNKLPLSFITKYYTMDEICTYYDFTETERYDILYANPNGLILGDNQEITQYNYQLLFLNHNFSIYKQHSSNSSDNSSSLYELDNQFIEFINTIKDNISDKAKQYLIDYSKITDENGVLNTNLSNVFSSTTFKSKCQENNLVFPKNIILKSTNNSRQNPFNYNSIVFSDQNLIENISSNNYSNYTDNIILTNVSNENKLNILNSIMQIIIKNYQSNDPDQYYSSYIIHKNDLNQIDEKSIIKKDNYNKTYLDLVVPEYQFTHTYFDDYNSEIKTYRKQTNLKTGWNYPSNNWLYHHYFIVGRYDTLLTNHKLCGSIKVRAYLDDIIAILDTKALAVSRIYIDDLSDYIADYSFITSTSGSDRQYIILN